MKIYKLLAIFALLLCSTLSVAFAQNYWCSSDGSGYLATMATPEISCAATKGSPDSYKSCVENVRKNNERTKADLQKGICKPIQEKQASYGQTKCKYFYIIENGKLEDKGHESYSLSVNSDFESEQCLQKAKEEIAKTIPAGNKSSKTMTSTQKNISQTTAPKTKPMYQYNYPPQYAPAQNYKNPSDAYKKH